MSLHLAPDVTLANSKARHGRTRTIIRHRTVNTMLDALALNVEAAKIAKLKDEDYSRQSVKGTSSFTGTKSAEEYVTMLRDGWTLGVQDVEGLDGLSTDASERLRFVRSVGGAFANVPAHLSGAPDAMIRPTMQSADNVRGLTLVIDAAFSCAVGSQTVLEYAKSVMRLIAWLAAEQIETAVYLTIAMNYDGGRYVYVIPVREAGDVMQPERIASLCHPSFLRRAWFAVVEHEYHDHKLPGSHMCNGSYGHPTTVTSDELKSVIPEAYSVILLPKVGAGDPMKAVQESDNLKLRRGEA